MLKVRLFAKHARLGLFPIRIEMNALFANLVTFPMERTAFYAPLEHIRCILFVQRVLKGFILQLVPLFAYCVLWVPFLKMEQYANHVWLDIITMSVVLKLANVVRLVFTPFLQQKLVTNVTMGKFLVLRHLNVPNAQLAQSRTKIEHIVICASQERLTMKLAHHLARNVKSDIYHPMVQLFVHHAMLVFIQIMSAQLVSLASQVRTIQTKEEFAFPHQKE